jgi:hypothetical protein
MNFASERSLFQQLGSCIPAGKLRVMDPSHLDRNLIREVREHLTVVNTNRQDLDMWFEDNKMRRERTRIMAKEVFRRFITKEMDLMTGGTGMGSDDDSDDD